MPKNAAQVSSTSRYPLLRLSTHIQWLTLCKGRDITDKLRQLLAAVSGRLPLESACDAVPELVFQCDHLVCLWIETRKDRSGVGKAGERRAVGQFARPNTTIIMARLTGLAIATESFMDIERFTGLDSLFQMGLSGGGVLNA